ncbi:MAG: ROK family protein [Bacteroidota bacterium]
MNTDFSGDESVLGVYISGYHITTLIVNLHTHAVLKSSYQRKAINSRGTAGEIIDSCCAVMQQALTANDVQLNRIGIAMPGPFDYEKGISYIHNNKKHEALYGLNVKEMIAQKLNIPAESICMLNDAASFLKGEVFAGVAQGYRDVIGMTLGTGLGTAKLSNGLADDANLWQSPFLDSIAEDYLSERWFLKRYYELSGINVVDVKELSSFYNTSNTVKSVFKEFAGNLALFTANFVRGTNTQIIVLSGDIAAKASDCFLPAYKVQLAKLDIEIPVCISKLNSDAVLMGVATCWL